MNDLLETGVAFKCNHKFKQSHQIADIEIRPKPGKIMLVAKNIHPTHLKLKHSLKRENLKSQHKSRNSHRKFY